MIHVMHFPNPKLKVVRIIMNANAWSCRFPCGLQIDTSTILYRCTHQVNKEQRSIAFLFREGSGLMTSQLRPLQFSTHCKILAKCLKFSYFVASDVWLLTPCGVTLCLSVPPCQTSQALENAKTHCAQSRPWLRVNQILEICPVNKE